MQIVRRSMEESVPPVTITLPDGSTQEITLNETAPGRFTARWSAPEAGLYRLKDGDLERVVAMGPASPREFEQTIASADPIAAAIAGSGGGVTRLEDGIPRIREIRAGRPSAGRGWIGITPRGATATTDIRVQPLLPAWAWLLLAALLTVSAWLVEGRNRRGEGGAAA
jgi:hypothetical protein